MKRAILTSFTLIAALSTAVIAGGPGGLFPFQHPSVFPATQVIGSGGTIAADACGGIKRISATSAVTTSLAYTIDTVNSPKAGCKMDILNAGTLVITLDNNASFVTPLNADIVLGTKHSVSVASNGSYWVVLGTAQNLVAH
jgi:hypothetical protein